MPIFWFNSSLLIGSFSNLKILVTSNTQISITVDSILLKASDRAYGASGVSLTNTITTSGVNGLDTGSEAANTWYDLWIIYNGTTLASLMCVAGNSPTLPSGYIYKARIGAVRNDASSNLYRTLQINQDAQYIVGTNPSQTIKMGSAATANDSTPVQAISVSSFVPPTASRIRGSIFGSNSRIGAAPNNGYSGYGITTNPPPVSIYPNAAGIASNALFDFLLESTNIYWFSNGTSNSISVLGWRDSL